ncbi:MAG: YIP1 family protein [Anaerolineae bacterium]|nr:YIP1 family protein [Anaerolineae bacterium]
MSEANATSPERRGLPRLLWGMIVRPRATLEYLREHWGRAWWLPALLTVILVTAPVVVAAPITARQSREAVAAAQEQWGEQRGMEMSAEEQAQMEQAMSIASSPLITVVFPAVGGVVVLAVGWLVWAGALYLAGMALGGRSTFGQMFRMVVWAWLPYTLRGLLQTVYILASGQIIANPGLSGLVQETRPISEIVVAPPGLGQTLLVACLSRIDLFLFWNLALLMIGVAVTTRLPRRKAVLVTLGVWLLLTALGLLPALVGGFFTQQFAVTTGP